ncbi:hypothetical protein MRX96_046446 [Rhipicephalus microplus]
MESCKSGHCKPFVELCLYQVTPSSSAGPPDVTGQVASACTAPVRAQPSLPFRAQQRSVVGGRLRGLAVDLTRPTSVRQQRAVGTASSPACASLPVAQVVGAWPVATIGTARS